MTGTDPKRNEWLRQGPPKYNPAKYGPMVSVRLDGPGFARFGGRAQRVPDKRYHAERWVLGTGPNKGFMINVIMARKNKRDYPEYDPIPCGPSK